MRLQTAIHSQPADSEMSCGSISMILDKPESLVGDQHGTSNTEASDSDTLSSGYSEVQLAIALQLDTQQRKMILLEQILTEHDIGEYVF